jgi:hypothetical protein
MASRNRLEEAKALFTVCNCDDELLSHDIYRWVVWQVKLVHACMTCWQEIVIEDFVNLELLNSTNTLQTPETVNWNFGSSSNELEEVRSHFSVKSQQYFPEHLYCTRVFGVIVVLGILSQVID